MAGKGKHVTERGTRGLGLGKEPLKRHRKVLKETIKGVTKGNIRRLARRGGVKRISAGIYDEIRSVLKEHLEQLLRDVVYLLELQDRQTVHVTDIVFVLNRHGRPIYGFGEGKRQIKDPADRPRDRNRSSRATHG